MKKTKIVYFIQDLHIGGAEKLLLQLIEYLDKDKFETILITFSNKGALFDSLPPSITKIYTTKNPLKLFSILKKEKPDIFHSHLWRADFLGIPLAKLAGIKKIFSTRHNVNYFKGIKALLQPFDALIMHFPTTVICISNAVKYHYQNQFLYRGINFQTIYNGINLTPFLGIEHQEKIEGEPLKILTVANLIKQKGHKEFLSILKEIKEIDWQWDLIGKGPEEKSIRKEIKKLKLENKIKFHGEQKDIIPFYKQANIFILPSLWEGFGLVLIEAMASRIPIFASDVDGIKEIIKDEKTGILFNYKNEQQTISKLKRLIQNEELRNKLALNGIKQSRYFSIETMTNKYHNYYSETQLNSI